MSRGKTGYWQKYPTKQKHKKRLCLAKTNVFAKHSEYQSFFLMMINGVHSLP